MVSETIKFYNINADSESTADFQMFNHFTVYTKNEQLKAIFPLLDV